MQWHLLHFASVCLEYYVAEASDTKKKRSVDAKEKENSIILDVWKAECSLIWTCHILRALLFGQTQAVAKATGAQPPFQAIRREQDGAMRAFIHVSHWNSSAPYVGV